MPDQNSEGNLGQGELPLKDQEEKKEGVAIPVASTSPLVTRPAARFVLDPDDTSITNWNIQH